MDRTERLTYFQKVKNALAAYAMQDIEQALICYYLHRDEPIKEAEHISKIVAILHSFQFPIDIEYMIEFFEVLIEQSVKDENGIVFTPRYIADYIIANTLKAQSEWSTKIVVLDPCCGCGIFLVAATEYIHKRFGTPIEDILCNNIYGMDIEEDNVKHCRLVLSLLCASYGVSLPTGILEKHIVCCDSLKSDWMKELGATSFNYVVGNPPYVNPHDMSKETTAFLKSSFTTTQTGVFNIFYAFIEKSYNFLSDEGHIGFIVPNNFLTIKSATELREFIQSKRCLNSILDFGPNMVFAPVRTYNCIIHLSKKPQDMYEYCVMEKTDNICSALRELVFSSMESDTLSKFGWKLVDRATQKNLSLIESQFIPIKSFIRTGIATLRDNVYFVERDENGYYKVVNGRRYGIESGIVKTIYKIPELKTNATLSEIARFIIFPYRVDDRGYDLISEGELQADYPLTYQYLLSQRDILNERDKGKGSQAAWYAYGRTQGLTKYGKKLLFPTFSNCPRFVYVEDENALFCNGYAVFENEYYDLELLCKILNSKIMDYYVSNTSYAIEGGYYCYQKRYIERFTLPLLSEDEIDSIREMDKEAIDAFLCERYGVAI